jgi:hypothetical protein
MLKEQKYAELSLGFDQELFAMEKPAFWSIRTIPMISPRPSNSWSQMSSLRGGLAVLAENGLKRK